MTKKNTGKPEQGHDFDLEGEETFVLLDRVVDPFLVLFHNPSGFRAEQYRALRNKLIFLNPEGLSRSLVVTSAIKEEGKSTTLLNLGLAFAELEGQSAIILDFDLRLPSVERLLGLNPEPGLTDLMLGRIPLRSAIRNSGKPGLDFIGAGLQKVHPAEFLSSGKIEELLSTLKEEYSYVLIDTPPILPFTDAGILSARADGTLLVIKLEASSKKLTKMALQTLQELGGNVLGTFVLGIRGADPSTDPRYGYPESQWPEA